MTKRKNMMDMTMVCERCGKVAPVDTKLSTPNWTVYRTKEPCECGGKYTARAFLDDRVRSSCDKETNHTSRMILTKITTSKHIVVFATLVISMLQV